MSVMDPPTVPGQRDRACAICTGNACDMAGTPHLFSACPTLAQSLRSSCNSSINKFHFTEEEIECQELNARLESQPVWHHDLSM